MLLELAHEAGLDPKHKANTFGGEYSASCPKCGGDDRFLLWPSKQSTKCEGSYWCRGCKTHGDTVQFCVDFLKMDYPNAFRRCKVVQEHHGYFKSVSSEIHLNEFLANKAWQAEITALNKWAHEAIWRQKDVLETLRKRGISKDAIKQYQLGFLPATAIFKRDFLELPPTQQGKDTIWIPKGITIPTFEKDRVIRLKIRRSEWSPIDKIAKYIAVSGSLGGMNLIGNRKKETIIAVESELDAYAVHWLVQDKALVIAVGSNSKHPDAMTHDLVKKSKRLLIIHDNDQGGQTMLDKWKSLYPKALGYAVPEGKDIGEAFELGLDIKKWLENLLA